VLYQWKKRWQKARASVRHLEHDVRLRIHMESGILGDNHWVAVVLIDNEQVGTADL